MNNENDETCRKRHKTSGQSLSFCTSNSVETNQKTLCSAPCSNSSPSNVQQCNDYNNQYMLPSTSTSQHMYTSRSMPEDSNTYYQHQEKYTSPSHNSITYNSAPINYASANFSNSATGSGENLSLQGPTSHVINHNPIITHPEDDITSAMEVMGMSANESQIAGNIINNSPPSNMIMVSVRNRSIVASSLSNTSVQRQHQPESLIESIHNGASTQEYNPRAVFIPIENNEMLEEENPYQGEYTPVDSPVNSPLPGDPHIEPIGLTNNSLLGAAASVISGNESINDWSPFYPCEDPRTPHMTDLNRRIQTYEGTGFPAGRFTHSIRDFATAGFYYLGEGTRLQCFFCNGGKLATKYCLLVYFDLYSQFIV